MNTSTPQDLSPAMLRLLDLLKRQAEVAIQYPGAYTNWLHVGGIGGHALTGRALVARKLVDVRVMPSGLNRITINADGLAALALAQAPAEAA